MSNDDIVTAFVREWDAPKPDTERLLSYFTDDAVYHNIPIAAVTGKAAIQATFVGMMGRLESRGWQVLRQISAGDVVMNERVDRFAQGDKKIELGGVADLGALTDRLGAGFRVLDDRFGHKFLRVLVPPWNRISAEITPLLGDLGFVGLSTFGKEQPPADRRVRWVNTHLDLVHWGANPIPLTFDESVTRLTDLLLNRRLWRVGLLTHHLVMDDAAFLALDRLLGLLLDHPRVVWRAPHELFGMPP